MTLNALKFQYHLKLSLFTIMWFAFFLFFNVLSAREEILVGRSGTPLYRIEVPEHWQTISIIPTQDSMLPIAEFKDGTIKIVIHNFPGMRIPPAAQVDRWKRQALARYTEPQSFSGFQGLLYENENTLAWAMEWGATRREDKECFSDMTIKVTCPEKAHLEERREAIHQAVKSFELIEDNCKW